MGPTYRITANCCPLLNTSYFKCSLNISRFKAKLPHEKKTGQFLNFNKIVTSRQKQAESSIIVQLNKFEDADACKELCSSFGSINSIMHYTTNSHLSNMVLVEYSSSLTVRNIYSSANRTNESDAVPIPTSVFQFHRSRAISRNSLTSNTAFPKFCHYYPTTTSIKSNLKAKKTISEQMMTFCKMMQLTDIDIRLRYFTAHQLLLCFSKLFPSILVLPFGSSATGLGAMGCDLDLVCTFNTKPSTQLNTVSNQFSAAVKSFSLIDKRDQQDFLRSMGFLMNNFIPGINDTRSILNARVPIIKFFYNFANFQCDLSSNNLSGFYMTEVLYTFTEMDCRVKPLIFTIRKWAEVEKVTTCVSPSNKITNFSLTLLIIFYLQRQKILPPLLVMLRPSDSKTIFSPLSSSAIEKQMNIKIENKATLAELLLGFFEFYATFDFSAHGICIREGKAKSKLDISPVYIYNPIEPTLNVSRNISLNELTLFIEKTISAVSVMTEPDDRFKLLDLISESSHISEIKKDKSHICQQLVLESLEVR